MTVQSSLQVCDLRSLHMGTVAKHNQALQRDSARPGLCVVRIINILLEVIKDSCSLGPTQDISKSQKLRRKKQTYETDARQYGGNRLRIKRKF